MEMVTEGETQAHVVIAVKKESEREKFQWAKVLALDE